MRRIALAGLILAIPLAALARDDGGGIDVIDVSGPLDALALDFIVDSIEDAAATGEEMVLLQIDSPAVLDSAAYERLLEVISPPPLPLAVWAGPGPANVRGGAAILVLRVQRSAIAPGSSIGLTRPVVLGDNFEDDTSTAPLFASEVVSAEESGIDLQPTLRQYLQALDGQTFLTTDGPVTVSTLVDFEGGITLREVTLAKPGLATRFFRLAVAPEAAFFFLVVGLAVVTFEFFALGPGVAAGVAALSLLPAGWGLVTLPTRWWALALVIMGWGLLTASYQRGGLALMTTSGAISMQLGGMALIEGSGQLDPRWWLVLPSVVAVLFFFLIAMPTVQRARLSTQTIGRESLVGLGGTALVDFDPDGLVEVGGARWRATAHREAGLHCGSEVVVTGVDGLFLEVEPSTSREN